jgi:Mn2+/Fe2+ NRAMP family transporter
VLTAFVLRPNWNIVLRETLLPSWPTGGHEVWAGLVAILGVTISPYLFFWQASQELEEKRDLGPVAHSEEQGAKTKRMRMRRLDVAFGGTLFSNLAMYS